jgi:lipooligosaccharide transport system permease protein
MDITTSTLPATRMAVPGRWKRVLSVYRRNLLVWRKLAVVSVLGNIADPLITLMAFGYGLGALLPSVQGVPYIEYLAAGSFCMSTMMAASFESLYSAYARSQVQRTWDSIMNAPLSLQDVVLAEWGWAATKAMFSAVAILIVCVLLGVVHSPLALLALPVALMIGLCFSAIGLCFTAVAKGYDFFTYYFTLALTPMVFLSGVYYPKEAFPAWLAWITQFLPLSAAIELARPLFLGHWPERVLFPVLVLVVSTVLALALAMRMMQHRFRT